MPPYDLAVQRTQLVGTSVVLVKPGNQKKYEHVIQKFTKIAIYLLLVIS